MNQGSKLTVYAVKDLAQAKALYNVLLDVAPYVDSPYYVGYKVGDQEIGLDPNGFNKGQTGPISYFTVSDIKAALKSVVDAGAQLQQDINDVGGGRLIAWVKDGDGNLIGLLQDPAK